MRKWIMKFNRDYMPGMLGILGFQGFAYFQSGDVSKLFWFAYFAFFIFFGMKHLTRGVRDERMVANHNAAWGYAGSVSYVVLLLMGVISIVLPSVAKLFFIMACTIGFFLAMMTYFISFIILERRS